jgi:hypothetical protein
MIVLLLVTQLYAEDRVERTIFEKNCLSCHNSMSVSFDKIFFRYLAKYSSELSVKTAMIDFLKNPNIQTTAMSEEQLRLLGIKSKTILRDKELKEAIDAYWDKYTVFGKLW